MNKEITMNIKDCEQAKSGDCCYCENMAYIKLKEENDGLKSEKDFLLQKIETLKTENSLLKKKHTIKNGHCEFFEGQTGLCRAKEFKRCNPVNCKIFTLDSVSTILKLQAELEALNNCDKTLIYKKARNNFEKLKKIEELADIIINTNCNYILEAANILKIIRGEE